MKTLNLIIKAIAALSALALVACDSDSGGGSSVSNQIDRMGRAAINTALQSTFTAATTRAAAEDVYNATANGASNSTFAANFADSLGVYDALVGGCADNDFTNLPSAGGTAVTDTTDGTRYDFVAGVLADDALYVNSGTNTCSAYLHIEGVVATTGTQTFTDCGGRAPSYDVVDVSYTLLASGLSGSVSDMVAVGDDDGDISDTTFPFLGNPLN